MLEIAYDYQEETKLSRSNKSIVALIEDIPSILISPLHLENQ